MNRTELVDAVAERLGDRRAAGLAVDTVLDAVTTALSDGQKVSLFGFGVFERVERAARTARNPATGGTVEVPATAVPRFRPGQTLKDAVNGRSSGTAQRRATSAGPRATRTADRAQARPAEEAATAAVTTAATTDAVRPRPGGTSDGKKTDRKKADSKKESAKDSKKGSKKESKKADARKPDSKKAGAKKSDGKKSDSTRANATSGGTRATRAKTR